MKNFSRQLNTGAARGRLANVLVVVLVLALLLLVGNLVYTSKQSRHAREFMAHAGELRVLSQRLVKHASEAVAGSGQGFSGLLETRTDFDRRWNFIQNGNPDTGLPAAPAALALQLEDVATGWARLRKDTGVILDSENAITASRKAATNLATAIPELQKSAEDAVSQMLAGGLLATQVMQTQRVTQLSERISSSVNLLLTGENGAAGAVEALGRDMRDMARVLKGLQSGDAGLQLAAVTHASSLSRIKQAIGQFNAVSGQVNAILEHAGELRAAREAEGGIFDASRSLLDKTSQLADGLEQKTGNNVLSLLANYVLGAIILAAVLLLMLSNARSTRTRLLETADKNERNQAAILRLLDEIDTLSSGDLTSQATVTEDFTGAIADSINFTIDQLRELVGTINNTAVQVATAAEDTQSTAAHLAEASEHQAQEIAGASAAINEIAVSIDQVSANASESAAVAERSVAFANKGSEVVHNTIAGMDKIREQIQDTSKRIKRLGESSQEIGDIVSLINDIADQTNILALNAAIQAAMAGDAGRGFAVVADEVQRLAERSSAATKQIEALVKAIQTDTNEAVISMEQTTTEVVKGANLAQDAGVSLEEIENVSKTLASLIQNISNAARQQAASAGHISNTMNVIQEITSQTSSGTTSTAQSIGHLAKLANEMRESVSGFTLPGQK